MPGIRLLLAAVLSLATASPTPANHDNRDDIEALHRRVQTISLQSLDEALQDTLAPKYRIGVFEHPVSALNAVHEVDPALASKVVAIASQEGISNDLRRRQSDNSTTTSSEPITSSSTTISTTSFTTSISSPPPSTDPPSSFPSEGTATGILIPITVISTNAAGQTQVQTDSAFQPSATVSVAQPTTTTNEQGQVLTTTNTVPAAVFTGTNSNGQAVTTTSPVQTVKVAGGSIVESGRISTSTRQDGGVVVVTYTPPGITVSRVVYRTTVLPNGQTATVTAFEVVGAAPLTSTINQAGQTSPSPKLISDGAAAPTGRYVGEMAVFVGGVLGLAAVL